MASPDTSKLALPSPSPSSPPYTSGKGKLPPPFGDYLYSLWKKTKKKMKTKTKRMGKSPMAMAWMKIYPRFKLEELIKATDNFHPDRIIKEDASYTLYQASLNLNEEIISCKIPVSIMRFKQHDHYFLHQKAFEDEMELLSNLHHPNIVSPMGYCIDGADRIIVHSPTPNGTLHDHLHAGKQLLDHYKKSPAVSAAALSWKTRLQICIGVARGLEYLHTSNLLIIHRDIKSSNILLDHNRVAKISNFQIAKLVSPSLLESRDQVINTITTDTLGYWDPEYYMTNRVTLKSDVYSFGVVLFEVLCGRKPMDSDPYEGRILALAFWGRKRMEDGKLDEIIDPRIKGEIEPECLKAYADLAYKCTSIRGDDRPAIGEVLKRLQLALLLQECIEANIPFSPSWLKSIVPPTPRSESPSSEPLADMEEGLEISVVEIQGLEISDDYDREDLPR